MKERASDIWFNYRIPQEEENTEEDKNEGSEGVLQPLQSVGLRTPACSSALAEPYGRTDPTTAAQARLLFNRLPRRCQGCSKLVNANRASCAREGSSFDVRPTREMQARK